MIEGLRKSYGSFEAVRGVTLHVGEGEVFALLGPNGAGKTTIVEILEGYRRRDAGDGDGVRRRPRRRAGGPSASASASCCRTRPSSRT